MSTVKHPGYFIAEEIESRGWIQATLAFIMGVEHTTISLMVNGKRNITPATSKLLGEAFGLAEDHFLKLQIAYDLSNAEEPPNDVKSRARIQQTYPLREMIKRGWLDDSEAAPSLESQLERFFGGSVPYLDHAAKKTDYDDTSPNQLAWLYRVRRIAEEMIAPRYSRNSLLDTVEDMKDLRSDPAQVHRVPAMLEKCGVRFVVVEGLPGSGIDGVCLWLDKHAPVIGMTLRFDRIDNFWFVLRHEIEHVLNGDGRTSPMVDADLNPTKPDQAHEELRANAAAADFCVPKTEMDSFFLRKNPFFSKSSVRAFATRIGVHPGLVAGQLQYRTENWGSFRDLQVKVRSGIISTALVDGWGTVIPTDN